MARYEVMVSETLNHFVIVDALDRDEAIQRGHNIVMNGNEDEYETLSNGSTAIEATELTEDN